MVTCAELSRRYRGAFFVALIAYGAIVVSGTLLLNLSDPPPGWLGPLIAALAIPPAVVMVIAGPLSVRRQDGVERDVLYRSSSLAFFVTMITVVTSALVQAFSGGPTVSPWWYWSVGMATWGVAAVVLHHKLS